MFDRPQDIEAGSTISCDVCVVGAGPAGITLAVELKRSPYKVVLVEAGGFRPGPVEEDHPYNGDCSGLPYSLAATRLRFFGGTSNHWGGWCRPLDPLDFEKRPYVPHSGWPIRYDDLLPFYERAQQLCEINPPGFGLVGEDWDEYLHSYDRDLSVKNFRFSPPTRFGRRYRSHIQRADNIRCLLDSSVVKIETRGSQVTRLQIRAAGKIFGIQAKNYVLAMGAIENARLLLHSDDTDRGGIGNEGGCVGHFFADHIGKTVGEILTSKETPYRRRSQGGVNIYPHLSLTDECLRREGLLNFGVIFISSQEPTLLDANYLSEDRLFRGWRGSREKQFFGVLVRLETAPNPDSVLRLTRGADANGVRRVELDWKLSGLEEYCLNRIADILGRKIGVPSVGRFHRTFFGGQEFREGDFSTQAHHLGTTRMSRSPSLGVVDPNCKVHGTSNLYIAGSSVFPAFGFANPTLTLVALAARLAEHLKQRTTD